VKENVWEGWWGENGWVWASERFKRKGGEIIKGLMRVGRRNPGGEEGMGKHKARSKKTRACNKKSHRVEIRNILAPCK